MELNSASPEHSKSLTHFGTDTSEGSSDQKFSCEATDSGKLVSQMQLQLGREDQTLNKKMEEAGIVDGTIDFLKNNFGASASETPFASMGDFLRTGWSYVLDYDSGSVAAIAHMNQAKSGLDAARVGGKFCNAK